MALATLVSCRVIEYEARATAALQQAISEESRVGQAQKETDEELQVVAGARATLQVGLNS